MEKQLYNIIKLFHQEMPIHYTLKEIRSEDNDCRWVLFLSFQKENFIIKIAANDFTSEERINGWNQIIHAYRKLGYYSPSILKSKQNKYAETITFYEKECIVWEEEYAHYHLRNTLDKNIYTALDGKYTYHYEVLEFLGKIAEKHYTMFPYKSGWVRFEPFGSNETTDEISECVTTFDTLVRKNTPQHILRWKKIYSLFEENKNQLIKVYKDLPTSVFQSDHFGDNLLLDEQGHFKGVIDYNLAGKDTVINVFLYTILFGYHYKKPQTNDSNLLPEYNSVEQDFVIESILEALKYLRKFYTFTENEAFAILPLYKYISCIEYTQIKVFKKYQQDDHKLSLLFDAMEHELMRKEERFYNIMLKIDDSNP